MSKTVEMFDDRYGANGEHGFVEWGNSFVRQDFGDDVGLFNQLQTEYWQIEWWDPIDSR